MKHHDTQRPLACIDVAYSQDSAIAAVILFESWTREKPNHQYVMPTMGVDPYVPGEFFRRELPPILEAIHQLSDLPRTILVDGYVWLNEREKRKGLGAHLYDALNERVPIIGVAKNAFSESDATPVYRGESRRPLYVTSVGIDTPAARRAVRSMHGDSRIPTLLKAVDRLCRTALLH